MIDTSGFSNESIPGRDLPKWTAYEALIKSDPELHHYTNRSGLEGICKTNSLWATHFSNLSDSSEIVWLKKPLEVALATHFEPQIMQRKGESFLVRDYVTKEGGADVVARNLAHSSVEAFYVLAINGGKVSTNAFTGGKVSPYAAPFICSLCSHANDHSYDGENGLLSQWRGYGGNCQNGRYALVFDTRQLYDLLALERQAHLWAKLDIEQVVYFEGSQSETLEKASPDLLAMATELMLRMLYKKSYSDIDILTPFLRAATRLKHLGFHEEREVRIVACPQSVRALVERGMKNELLAGPPIKKVRGLSDSKKVVKLFESVSATLPIKRIIVGPSSHQNEDCEFAQSVVSHRVPIVPIVKSETPYIG
jgi:hypothetical protein